MRTDVPSSFEAFPRMQDFTGARLGVTVIPKALKCGDVTLNSLWARRHGTKFNGAPYIVQQAGAAVYTPEGQAQTQEQIAYYMNNAKIIREGLAACRIYCFRRCECAIYLAEDTGQDDFMGIL